MNAVLEKPAVHPGVSSLWGLSGFREADDVSHMQSRFPAVVTISDESITPHHSRESPPGLRPFRARTHGGSRSA
jgi:hypothetical protein